MNIPRISLDRTYQVGASGAPRKAPKPGSTAPQGDSVSLSATAEHLSAARAALEEIPDVRMDRVSSLKKAIEQGEYALDPRKTAEAILRHAAEIAASSPSRAAEGDE